MPANGQHSPVASSQFVSLSGPKADGLRFRDDSTACDMNPPSIPAELLLDAHRMLQVLAGTSEIAGYELSNSVGQRFQVLNRHSRIDHPEVLERLRPAHEGKRDWHPIFVDAVMTYVLNGVAAAEFYLADIRTVQANLRQRIHQNLVDGDFRALLPNETIASGNVRRLDFSYQSHVVAVRRTVEYFAGSVSAFFKQPNPGFRGLKRGTARAEPAELRELVHRALDRHIAVSDRLLSASGERSVRDRISHWDPVPAGVLNVTVDLDGQPLIFFAGGGENLDRSDNIFELADLLESGLAAVLDMIFDTYTAMGIMPLDPLAAPE